MSIQIGIILAVSGTIGCGTPQETSGTALPNPLEQFQSKVEKVSSAQGGYVWEVPLSPQELWGEDSDLARKHNAEILEARRQHEAGVRWRKYKYWTSSTKYDVRRTDSLVSPYVAELTFVLHHASSPDLRQDEANAFKDGDPRQHFWRSEVQGAFAFQDGKWVNTSLKTREPSIALLREWRDATLHEGLMKVLLEEH